MIRDYKTGVKEGVGVFSGKEIEHTPAFGLQTLFIANNGLTYEQLHTLAQKVNAKAIYYGANRTYMHNRGMQLPQMKKFLDAGFYVTVDYPYNLHEEVKEKFEMIWDNEKFIPFCSIIFPNVEKDKTLCFKVDDVDFNKTNKGVWTMTMKDFQQKAGFTKWEDYKKDEPIEEKDTWLTQYQQIS